MAKQTLEQERQEALAVQNGYVKTSPSFSASAGVQSKPTGGFTEVGNAIGAGIDTTAQVVDNAINAIKAIANTPRTMEETNADGTTTYYPFGKADNPYQGLEPLGQSLQKVLPTSVVSNTDRLFLYNNDTLRYNEAVRMGKVLDIDPDVIMRGDDKAFERADYLSRRVERGAVLQDIYDEFPELYKVKYGSQAEQLQAINNLQSIRATKSTFDAIQQGIWSMNDQMKLGDVGFELAHTKDPERINELTSEMERLQNNLRNYRTPDGTNPLQEVFGQTAAQAYMMGKQGGTGAIIGGAIGAVIGGLTTDGVGIGAGALTGAKWGGGADMAYEMYKMSFGNKYLELINKRDANGNKVYSNDEAYKYAMTYAAVDTGIEMASTRFMIKGVGKVAPKAVMSKVLQGATSDTIATFNRGIGTTVAQMAKASVKAGGSELVEEGLQDINEKFQHNLYRNANDPEGVYSIGDMAVGAGGAMLQALPAVIGLGAIGGGVSGIHTMKAFHEFQKLTPEQQQQAVMAEQNRNGNAIMQALKQDASSNKMAKENPELYGKIVQAQGDNVGVSTAYVNVNEMAETEEGQQAIKNMIDSGLVTQEEVSKSIEANADIPVPIGKYAQLSGGLTEETVKALEESTYFTRGGMSMKTLERAKAEVEAFNNNLVDATEKKAQRVKESIIRDEFEDASDVDREVLDQVFANPTQVKQAYNNLYKNLVQEYRENYASDFDNMDNDIKEATASGVEPQWLTDYKSNNGGKAPRTNAERRRAAFHSSVVKAQTAFADNAEALNQSNIHHADMEHTLQQIESLERLHDKIFALADNDIALRMQLSKSGYDVYNKVVKAIGESTDRKQRETAKANALLMAQHADVMAQYMRQMGRGGYTAMDYFRDSVRIKMDAVLENQKGYAQKKEARNLVAYHNISADGLSKALKLGGLPVPSIAITNKDIEYNNFGDISLVIPKEVVDPKTTPIFSRDAWTQTFPHILKAWREENASELYDKMLPILKELKAEDGQLKALKDARVMDIDDSTSIDFVERIFNKDEVKYYFLSTLGKAPKIKYGTHKNGSTYIDSIKLREDIDKKLNVKATAKSFEVWKNNVRESLLGEPKIEVNGRKVDLTLENVVTAMVGQQQNKQKGMFGNTKGSVIAASAKRIKSMKSLKSEAENKISGDIDLEDERNNANKAYEEVKQNIDAFMSDMVEHYEYSSSFDAFNDALQVLIAMQQKKKDFNTAARSNHFTPTDDMREKAESIVDAISNLPVKYFEAKPQRAVKFDEIKAAIVPKGTDKTLIKELKSHGIHIEEYENGVENSRVDAIKRADEAVELYFQNVNGLTEIMSDGERIISIFKTADRSTFLHEMGHVFFDDIQKLASMDNAPKQLLDDWNTLKEWSGWVDGENVDNTKAHERFARGWESYLRSGEAPTKGLQRVFRQFSKWLTRIYRSVQRLGGEVPSDIKDIMARMIATQDDIENYAHEQALEQFENTKLYQQLSESEQARVQGYIADIKEKAKERVMRKYMKELDNRPIKEWEDVKDDVQSEIEKRLVEEYPIYKEHQRYMVFGADALKDTQYQTIEGLEKAEREEAGSTYDEAVAQEMENARNEFINDPNAGKSNQEIAEEMLLSNQGQMELTQEEARLIKAHTNKELAKNWELLSKLQKLDPNSENLDEELKPIEKELTKAERIKKDHARVAQELGSVSKDLDTAQERIENLKAQLQERIDAVRAIRDGGFGTIPKYMERAKRELGDLTLSQASQYKKYQNQAVRDGKKADGALATGKVDEALQAKQSQMLNQARARVAFENSKAIKKLRVKLLDQLNRMTRSQNPIMVEPNMRYFYTHMAYQMGLTKYDGLQPVDGFDMMAVIKALDADADIMGDKEATVQLEQWIYEMFDAKSPRTFSTLKMSELEHLEELMTGMYKSGRTQYDGSTLIDEKGNNVTFDQAIFQIIDKAAETFGRDNGNVFNELNNRSRADALSNTLNNFNLSLLKAETFLRRLDGGKNGPAVRYIYEPINKATQKFNEYKEKSMYRLARDVKAVYSKKQLFDVRNDHLYSVGELRNVTKEQIIMLALNWGTEKNRQRALETIQSNEVEMERAFQEYMTDKDWEFVIRTWEHINSFYEERSKVQEELYGNPLKKEKGITFTIGGREIQGQYFPIVYNPKVSAKVSDFETEDIAKTMIASNAIFGTGMGATKSRLDVVKGKSLMLDFDVIPNAITEAINHVTMRKAVTDVNKLVGNSRFQEYIVDKFGMETYQFLRTWVRDNWKDEASQVSTIGRLLMTLKKRTTEAVMIGRVSVALQNALNIPVAMYRIGVGNTLKAISDAGVGFYGVGTDKYNATRDFVLSQSIFMRERVQTLDKDLKQGLSIEGKGLRIGDTNIGGYKAEQLANIRDDINQMGFRLLTETDFALSIPVWKFAYDNKVLELQSVEGVTAEFVEQEAISAGDRAVRDIFGSGDTKDSAGIQRSRDAWVQLFVPFYSYANTLYNILAEGYYGLKDQRNYGQFVRMLWGTIVIPALGMMAYKAMTNGDDDSPEDLVKSFIEELASQSIMGVPLVRDVANMTMRNILGEKSFGKTNSVIATSIVDKLQDMYTAITSKNKDATDVGRSLSQVSNRIVGFSDTITDGLWTLSKFALTDTDAKLEDVIMSIILDKKLKDKKSKKKDKH